jgi:hypothetical protein
MNAQRAGLGVGVRQWRSSVAATSSAVTVLPLWNSTPCADLHRPGLGVVGRADLLGEAVFERPVTVLADEIFAPHALPKIDREPG